MSYELFQQGPEAYIPILLVSLVLTLFAYGAFPLIFAMVRKNVISQKKYNILCYCINFLVMLLFFSILNGEPGNIGPYFLWTWLFSSLGLKNLKKRGVLEGFQTIDYTETSAYEEAEVKKSDIALESEANTETHPLPEEKPQIRFCRKCGFELIVGSEFCSKCGTTVVKE